MAQKQREHVTDFLFSREADLQNCSHSFVLIVLNYTLPTFFPMLWRLQRLRVCADGGANRMFDELPLLFPQEEPESVRRRFVPDVIIGDLDSIRSEIREYYSKLGSVIIDLSEDQDSTDLDKCIVFIENNTPELDTAHWKIIVVGALGGRVDHEFANYNALYRFSHLQLILVGSENLIFLLQAGFEHLIRPNLEWEGPHCALIPLGEPSASSTTTGLQWNLSGHAMRFGALVSTSNRLTGREVTVRSDADLLWTVELHAPQGGAVGSDRI